MSNVSVTKDKLDILANAIANKSGEPLTLTLDEMVSAVDGIETGGGGITPTGNIDITQAGVTDVTNYATATVPQGDVYVQNIMSFKTVSGSRKWEVKPHAFIYTDDDAGAVGYIENFYDKYGDATTLNAVPRGTTITPTESTQTIGGVETMMEGAVTVNAIPSNYVGSGITQRSSTDLTVSGATVTAPSGYYSASASKSVASGTAGTPTATKGAVSNHSVSVTPSVTNTTGYITGGTKSGTAVTVSASELVSGSETKTENGTYDVTNLASVVVNVSGSSSVQTGIGQAVTGTNDSLIFAVLGNPTSFSLIYTGDITIGETPIVSAIAFDGTDYVGQIVTNTANAQASYISTGFSHTYYSSEQGIQINSTDAVFSTYSNYKLVYTYGGSSSDIHTANVQVGSGATSITFPVSGRPTYWSCVFKSNFGTSSGYQRVIATGNDGSSTYGMCLDSSAHASNQYWTASYSGGNLTISSQGTNAGGYFHQPGYYQLTYIVDESAPSYQTKTVTPTTSQQTVTADNGYDALSQVTVNAIPSEYIIPSGNLPITQNGNNINVSQYATVSVNVSGGGSLTVATKTTTLNATSQTLSFSSLSGQPKYWFLRATTNVSSSGSTTYYYVTDCFYDGTNIKGNTFRIGSTRRVQNITSGITQSYNEGTLTITAGSSSTATPGQFYGASNFGYELVYIY